MLVMMPGNLVRRIFKPPLNPGQKMCLYERHIPGSRKWLRNVMAEFSPDDVLLIIYVASGVEMLLMTPTGALGWDQNDHHWQVVCAS